MNILIVDDNQDNRMTVNLLLEDIKDINVEEAIDGAEAILKCREKNFDLIFMDIMMPKVDGIEATKEIKSFSPASMIIALSALDDEKSKHAMLQSGAQDYITKPIDSELFVQRAKNYMTILSMRSKPIQKTQMVSLFSDTAYPLSKKFTINSEAALAFFWNDTLNKSEYGATNISDTVRILYGLGLWLLKTNHPFAIIIEENDEYLYVTQTSLDFISSTIIRSILLKHCKNSLYVLHEGVLSFKLPKIQVISTQPAVIIEIPTQAKEILSKTHFNKITAIEYLEMTAISFMDKIESLETIEEELDIALLAFEKQCDIADLQKMSELFLTYVEVIKQLVEFEHLSYAIASLANFLANLESSKLDENKIKKLVTLMLGFIADLNSWRVNIFVNQEANDIHYLDSSLLSSCLQIESIFKEEGIAEEEDDLEFF